MQNNFYNEYPHARNIEQSLPTGNIPKSVSKEFVKVISICYVGNGKGYREGVDETAIEYYEKFIDDKFTDIELLHFINLFADHEFVTDFDKAKVKERVKKLVQKLKIKTSDILIQRALDVLEKANNIQKVVDTADYKEALKVLR